MNRASAATCLRTALRPAGPRAAAARLSSHVPWFVSAALSHVVAWPRPSASRSWARLMSSSSAQSCMLDGGEDGADAERLRASERAVVALAIANWTVWTDAANGSPADRALATAPRPT